MKHRSLSSWWITLNIFNPLRVSSSYIGIVELSRGSFVENIRGGGPHPGPGGEVIPSVSCSTCCPPTSSDIHRHPATRCNKHQYLALFISVHLCSIHFPLSLCNLSNFKPGMSGFHLVGLIANQWQECSEPGLHCQPHSMPNAAVLHTSGTGV